MSNFQNALLNSTIRSQGSLSSKESADSQAGILANVLLTDEYSQATLILQGDSAAVSAASSSDQTGPSTTYQNDASVAQTGESNANTAVQQEQTQSSQDGTNLSNLVSLSSTLIAIGQYVAGLIQQSY